MLHHRSVASCIPSSASCSTRQHRFRLRVDLRRPCRCRCCRAATDAAASSQRRCHSHRCHLTACRQSLQLAVNLNRQPLPAFASLHRHSSVAVASAAVASKAAATAVAAPPAPCVIVWICLDVPCGLCAIVCVGGSPKNTNRGVQPTSCNADEHGARCVSGTARSPAGDRLHPGLAARV